MLESSKNFNISRVSLNHVNGGRGSLKKKEVNWIFIDIELCASSHMQFLVNVN